VEQTAIGAAAAKRVREKWPKEEGFLPECTVRTHGSSCCCCWWWCKYLFNIN
jgi:hypothetical protein